MLSASLPGLTAPNWRWKALAGIENEHAMTGTGDTQTLTSDDTGGGRHTDTDDGTGTDDTQVMGEHYAVEPTITVVDDRATPGGT